MENQQDNLHDLESLQYFSNHTRHPIKPIDESKYWLNETEKQAYIKRCKNATKQQNIYLHLLQTYNKLEESFNSSAVDNKDTHYWATVAYRFSKEAEVLADIINNQIKTFSKQNNIIENNNKVIMLYDELEHLHSLSAQFKNISIKLLCNKQDKCDASLNSKYWAEVARYFADLIKEYHSSYKTTAMIQLDKLIAFRCEHPELTGCVYEENFMIDEKE